MPRSPPILALPLKAMIQWLQFSPRQSSCMCCWIGIRRYPG